MKYGLIGCGRIATNPIKAVLNNNLEFVAVCDIEESQINNLLAKHGLDKDTAIKHYIDYKKMIEQNKLDLVAIATERGITRKLLYTVSIMVLTVLLKSQ